MRKKAFKIALGILTSWVFGCAFSGGPDAFTAPQVTSGLYVGLGGSWNSVDVENAVDVRGILSGNITLTSTSRDVAQQHQNQLAPVGQIGYWALLTNEWLFDCKWLWGVQVNYQFLNTRFDEVDLVNAGQVVTSVVANTPTYLKVRITHEVFILPYLGVEFGKGFIYLGAGPVMLRVQHKFGDSVVSITNGVGTKTDFSATVFSNTETAWGGGAQIGYNYYFKPNWFFGLSYSYLVTSDTRILHFATKNTHISGFPEVPGIISNDSLTSNNSTTVQELMFSINKVFTV